jgi:Rod binding domain-containing protein
MNNIYELHRPRQDRTTGEIRRRSERNGNFGDTLAKTIERGDGSDVHVSGRKKRDDEKLRKACLEMESLFVSKMLNEMRKTIHKNRMFHGGFAEEIFEDMLFDEYSMKMSEKANFGLAKMLYEELSRK